MKQTDYLIFGSGVAGLTFAIKIAMHFPDKNVTIITKSNADESNTKYAQGGIAVVLNQIEDNFQKHINDTLICGDGLCKKDVVEMVVKEGPKCVQELIDWGTQFDKNETGSYDLGKEGGHSYHRVIHHKDQTGFEIERAILKQAHLQKNITILDFHFGLELLIENNKCFGSTVLNEKTNEIITFLANQTLLATGGIGQIYGHTTNPEVATGDGIAMANRANANIKDVEFIQFHPTALYNADLKSTFLISEAVRGFGAILRDKNGKRFMFDYDARGELASRDIVSQSIEKELKISGEDSVFLDCTHLEINAFKKHFPMIYERCKDLNIFIETDWIPVIPAQHYLCGGIEVDTNGKTSVENLFACGECSYTGLHGANRLASNSLLEALVYSDRIFNYLKTNSNFLPGKKSFGSEIIQQENNFDKNKKMSKIRTKLQNLMQKNVGIVRNNNDLNRTLRELIILQNDIKLLESKNHISKELYELKNMIDVSILIVNQSLQRTLNCGSFYKV
ncbi:L-aspartate oxidase [uncultured Flavobacterium sp.]|uniref:L-aspartate oxidase n=1 Tax=uncultured Flavobacterium sp. TaxID=165435 RepID=UPI0030EDA168|tara:strand:+ start:238469 stop:239989 length:1521 start_codon:yes stop_codon:yes gene_type:complete